MLVFGCRLAMINDLSLICNLWCRHDEVSPRRARTLIHLRHRIPQLRQRHPVGGVFKSAHYSRIAWHNKQGHSSVSISMVIVVTRMHILRYTHIRLIFISSRMLVHPVRRHDKHLYGIVPGSQTARHTAGHTQIYTIYNIQHAGACEIRSVAHLATSRIRTLSDAVWYPIQATHHTDTT